MRTTAALILLGCLATAQAAGPGVKGFSTVGTNVLSGDHSKMLSQDVRQRIMEANKADTQAWGTVKSRADWEKFRDPRIAALRESLGQYPAPPKRVPVRVSGTIEGDGYTVEKVLFESRPGFWVTANRYRPAKDGKAMPGILIAHSHHNPKTQGELQDMGETWAKLGCVVLVPDLLGHGERRVHPFVDADSFKGQFAVGRQDYFFRYNLGMQLSLLGDSLMGWNAYDLMRGVDVLLAQPGIDKERIILLGAVAGGGDPAGVTAALDPRITCVVPFNFGGPQPETVYPLPADAETAFNYAGGGSWESTRNLRRSAKDGFLPWVIVGSVAPRGHVYGHEFAWDRERDPVWRRLNTVYGFYEAPRRLDFAHGRGKLSGQPPEATHCNNIGPEHRAMIYPALKKFFDMPSPEKETRDRRAAADLSCWTEELRRELKPQGVYDLAGDIADERLANGPKDAAEIRTQWAKLLGRTTPAEKARGEIVSQETVGPYRVERIAVRVEREIVVPAVLIYAPVPDATYSPPVVVGVAQEGKARFLRERAAAVEGLVSKGVAVCLVDVRGTGETAPGSNRGRNSPMTSLSSSEQMLGETMLGARLRDVSAVLTYLSGRTEFDAKKIALWGESFAPATPVDRDLRLPLDVTAPEQAEPLGGLLAVFGALFDDRVQAVYVRGGLESYRSALGGPFVYIPHDCIVPGALTVADLPDVVKALGPRKVRLEAMITAQNRRVDGRDGSSDKEVATWFLGALKAR